MLYDAFSAGFGGPSVGLDLAGAVALVLGPIAVVLALVAGGRFCDHTFRTSAARPGPGDPLPD